MKEYVSAWGLVRFAAIVLLAFASGCVSQPRSPLGQVIPAVARDAADFAAAQLAVRETFPPVYRATQRAIITVRKRQFVCDGLLSVSPIGGWHLALISTLGLVTDVRVNGDGSSEVLKVTPLLPEAWAREYVTLELRWLFKPPPPLAAAGRLNDQRLLLEAESLIDGVKARYVCSRDGRRWEQFEAWKGHRLLFHAKLADYRVFDGCSRALPAEIEVDAGTHRLNLRTAEVNLAVPPAAKGPR